MWGRGPQIQAALGAREREHGEATIILPMRVKTFGDDYACMIECGSTFAMAVMSKFPPGVEERRVQADQEAQDTDETEATEAAVSNVQEACFWANRMGYPVILGATENVTRLYLEGVRGEEVDKDVSLCYAEVSLRLQFKNMFRK